MVRKRPTLFPVSLNAEIEHQKEKKEHKPRSAPAEQNPDPQYQNLCPAYNSVFRNLTEEQKRKCAEQIKRIGIRILEKAGLPSGHQEPAFFRFDKTEKQCSRHHDTGDSGQTPQKPSPPVGRELLQCQHKQREWHKLDSTDCCHTPITTPYAACQQEEHQGCRGQKNRAAGKPDPLVYLQHEQQHNQRRTHQRR